MKADCLILIPDGDASVTLSVRVLHGGASSEISRAMHTNSGAGAPAPGDRTIFFERIKKFHSRRRRRGAGGKKNRTPCLPVTPNPWDPGGWEWEHVQEPA